MVSTLSPEYILLALLLVVPGFISTLLAINLGVVEGSVSDTKILGVSLVSSVIIDTIFLSLYQLSGGEVTSLSGTRTVFFSPQFRPEFVLSLLVMSLVLGGLYAIGITYELPERARRAIWSKNRYTRHHRQPWEGALEDAHEVAVITSDRELVNGILAEYSRVEKERQVVLTHPVWLDRRTGEMKDEGEHSVVLLEDDIERLSVITTK